MPNRILDVVVVNYRLDPHETELRVHVKTEHLTPTTEIRGRLLGPRCAYSSTIEIAYALREVERSGHLELRAVIPEASWWDPESPFLYDGAIELWHDGALGDRIEFGHGIRVLQINSKGLRLNGRPFLLRGRIIESSMSESAAQNLRAAGINTLFVNVVEPRHDFWRLADRLGFFVLVTTDDPQRFVQLRNDLAGRASTFGWVFNRAAFAAGPCDDDERAFFYGVNTSATGLPPNADFLFCHDHELVWLGDVNLPKVVVVKRLPETQPARPDVIGWIEIPTT
jgi:hypothetical protein